MSRFLSRYYGWFLHLGDSRLLLKRALSSMSLVLPTVQVFVDLDHAFVFAFHPIGRTSKVLLPCSLLLILLNSDHS